MKKTARLLLSSLVAFAAWSPCPRSLAQDAPPAPPAAAPSAVQPASTVPPPPGAPAPPPAAGGYEATTTLRASQILQPVFLSGPSFRVGETVVNEWGMNTYTIDTTLYGTFVARGSTQLLERLAEISALQRMDAVARTKEYAEAVEDAADEAEDLAEDAPGPKVDSLEDAPSTGVGKFFHRLGKDVKEGWNEGKGKIYSKRELKSSARVAGAKRDLCRKLGINPYTTNATVQARIDGMSRVLGLGEVTFKMGEASADPIVSAINANGGRTPPAVAALVYEKGPAEISAANQAALQQVGVGPVDAAGFAASPAFTPWLQSQFVSAVQNLAGVTGLDLLVRDAASAATEETDAIFYAETAQLMAQFQAKQWQIIRIELNKNVPYCVLRDGSVLLALHWDYASWTPTAEKCAQWLQTITPNGQKPPTVTIAITGAASPRCRQEMESRGIRLLDRLSRGALN